MIATSAQRTALQAVHSGQAPVADESPAEHAIEADTATPASVSPVTPPRAAVARATVSRDTPQPCLKRALSRSKNRSKSGQDSDPCVGERRSSQEPGSYLCPTSKEAHQPPARTSL
ncbi:hypothetical protein WJX73_001990 [Symbiochloris irregularis]|uniref:Uncharacterized protein n=1 Tax=Symbiochloris irregularis TaxID=706552 RepID=A0AAW1PMS6_9CHLO